MPMAQLVTGASAELVAVRAQLDAALEERCATLYRHATRLLHGRGMSARDALAVLRDAIPCYAVTDFRVTGWSATAASPACRAILRTLPVALADLATASALARRPPPNLHSPEDGQGPVATVLLRPTRLRVTLCLPSPPGGDHPRPRLSIVLTPGTPSRRAVEAVQLSGRSD